MVIAAGMPVAWVIARAAGLVALGLLTTSVTLGLAMSTKLLSSRRQKGLFEVHQTLIWTEVGMLVLHAGALVVDPVMHFGVLNVLVPGTAPWRPVAVGAGIVAGWLMLALALSFRVRKRIGQRRWRLFHYVSFGAFAIALWHGLSAGTDLKGTTGLVIAAGFAAPVLWLTFARILMPRPERRPTQRRTVARPADVVSRPAAVERPKVAA